MKSFSSAPHAIHTHPRVRISHVLKSPRANGIHQTQTCRSSSDKSYPSIEVILSKPSWSVSSLLPSKISSTTPLSPESPTKTTVTPDQLRKLLRLAALPYPETKDQEAKMLSTLQSQLHFVQEVQSVDTRGVAPLRSIRDESTEAERENEITVDSLRDAFAKERIVGKHYKRIRRVVDDAVAGAVVDGKGEGRRQDGEAGVVADWDVLGQTVRRAGNYFVVDRQGRDMAKSEDGEA